MNAIGTKLLPKNMGNVIDAGLAILSALDKSMKFLAGITLAEYSVLDAIQTTNQGEPLCMSDLADGLGCQKSNMTQLIDRMQKRKLVVRKPHLYNQRMLMVHVEDAGREAHDKVKDAWDIFLKIGLTNAASYGLLNEVG
jgi:DNA-binding MarR family transcriptional regulator